MFLPLGQKTRMIYFSMLKIKIDFFFFPQRKDWYPTIIGSVYGKISDTNQNLLCQFWSSKCYLSFEVLEPLYLYHFWLLVIFLLLDAPSWYVHQQYLHTVSTVDWLICSNTIILEVMLQTWEVIQIYMTLWIHWVHSLPVSNGARVEGRVLAPETPALELWLYHPVFYVGLLGPLRASVSSSVKWG